MKEKNKDNDIMKDKLTIEKNETSGIDEMNKENKENENSNKEKIKIEKSVMREKKPANVKQSEDITKKKKKCNRKNNKYDIERMVLYAVSVILLALVISLAVKNYSLESKLDNLNRGTAVATDSSADKTKDNKSTSGEDASAANSDTAEKTNADSQTGETVSSENGLTTEAAEPLTVQGDVQYVDTPTPKNEEKKNYNGDDLADNGHPYAIKVNRQENIVTVYSLDKEGYYTVPVRVMRCSVSPVGETPTGTFNIALKWDWLALFDNCYGQYVSQIEGDTLFHSVPYLDTTKDSLETWEFNKLGTGASLGCVRLCVADTKWIYDNCESGTYVNIFDSDYYGPLGRPVPVTKLQNTEEQGWDPTDMVEENPTTGKGVIYGAESHSIKLGENYDTMAGVMAFNSQREDVTDQVKTEGSVDNNKAGKYNVKYSFDDQGQEVSKTIVITVEDDEAPVITKVPVELKVLNYNGQKEELAQLIASYVSAQDGEAEIKKAVATDGKGHRLDGTDISKVKENVICVSMDKITDTAGTYSVACSARDASGNVSQNHTVNVTIIK